MNGSNGGKKSSRRKFIKKIGGGIVATQAWACIPHVEGSWSNCQIADGGEAGLNGCTTCVSCPTGANNRVVEVSSSQVLEFVGDTQELKGIREEVVVDMVNAGLSALAGNESISTAWASIVPDRKESEIVGIKVNALNAQVPTTPQLVRSLVGSLLEEAGVAKADILVWDRSDRDLQKCGLTSEALGVPCQGTVGREIGSGPGYETSSACLSGKKIYLSTLLTKKICHLINVAVMKNHGVAAFTGCLKNHYGSFSAPEQFHDNCEQHIANLNALPQISQVSRLQVLDALIGVSLGDTASPFDCFPKRILFGFDPVAVDRRGVEIRDEMRKQLGAQPGAYPKYLQNAVDLGLGTTEYDLVKIDLG